MHALQDVYLLVQGLVNHNVILVLVALEDVQDALVVY